MAGTRIQNNDAIAGCFTSHITILLCIIAIMAAVATATATAMVEESNLYLLDCQRIDTEVRRNNTWDLRLQQDPDIQYNKYIWAEHDKNRK